MDLRMFHYQAPDRKTHGMTTRMYANQANGMAGDTRVLRVRPCPVSPAVSTWSPIDLGATAHKHGRPRRTEVSHQ